MAKEIEIKLSKKSAKELADLELDLGMINKEDYNEQVEEHMKPKRALFG